MVLNDIRHIYLKQDRSPNICFLGLADIALAIVRVHSYLDELVYSLIPMVFLLMPDVHTIYFLYRSERKRPASAPLRHLPIPD